MEDVKYKCIARIYHLFCLFAAITLTSWCIYEYSMDRDITEIRLRKFHETKDDIHPSITMCSLDPFWDKKYRSYLKNHSKLNITNEIQADSMIAFYRSLINAESTWLQNTVFKGKNESYEDVIQRFQVIDYDSSTLSLKDLISEFKITVPINSEELAGIHYNVLNDTHIVANNESSDVNRYSLQELQIINTYIIARQPYYKCFTIDIPFKRQADIREIAIRLNTSIFDYGLSLSSFYFTFTYPKQFIRTPIGSRILIPKNINRLPQCYKFEIHLGSMKVFKRRNKANSPCNPDWLNHDHKQLNKIIEKVGCNPMHWKQIPGWPSCSTPDQYAEINKQIYKRNEFMPPCRSIEKLAKTTRGSDLGSRLLGCVPGYTSHLDLQFFLDEEIFYEEVVLVPAYDIQHLVGNAGNCCIKG